MEDDAAFVELPPIDGVRFSTAATGIKYTGRDDVMLAHLVPGSAVAGVFTKSSTRSAAVLDCQQKLGGDASGPAAILVNSGNANAFTGRHGAASVESLCAAVSESIGVPRDRVFTASTGVIGEVLPHEKIITHLTQLRRDLGPEMDRAAHAIMTTDTRAKGATRICDVGGQRVTISGFAKGSGMIAPDMATMLAYIFTDAKIAQGDLQTMTALAAERSFNRISVDSDTSTSDTVMVAATGTSSADVTGVEAFSTALEDVMRDLAHQIVRDGEGASKFVEVTVTGARSETDAKTHALAIANSPLVKTAIAGEDPNWGRIVMAIGKSGAEADRDLIAIRFGDVLVAEAGWVHPDYREEDGARHMKERDISITVDLGLGTGEVTVWTCDLTHGYIEINADYRS